MSALANQLIIASPTTLADLVAQLPAETRAQVAWTPKRITDMAASLLNEPFLTDTLIEAAVEEYLEAVHALSPLVAGLTGKTTDASELVQAGTQRDLIAVKTLPSAAANAAVRAAHTLLWFGNIGLQVLSRLDTAVAQQLMEPLKTDAAQLAMPYLKSACLLMAVVEGVQKGSPIPGRVAALARRADEAAQEFARWLASMEPAAKLPWYDRTAPDAEAAAGFAVWSVAPSMPRPPPTQEQLEAWERVKASIDAERPHRKLFS